MNEILKIIEKRNLYVHIILFKVHIETEGRTNEYYSGHLEKDIENLMGEQFDLDDYNTATQFLESEGLTEEGGYPLTRNGRSYIEDWANNFEDLSEEDKRLLAAKLNPRLFGFFGFAENTNTVLSLIQNLVETFKVLKSI